MGYLTGYLSEKRKWSKTKLELLNAFLNILFMFMLLISLWIVVQEQQKCQVKINNWMVNFSMDYPPNISDIVIQGSINTSNCIQEEVCYNRTVCEYLYDRQEYFIEDS